MKGWFNCFLLLVVIYILWDFSSQIENFSNYPHIDNYEPVRINLRKTDNHNGNMKYPGLAYLGISSDKSFKFKYNNESDDYSPSKTFPFLGGLV